MAMHRVPVSWFDHQWAYHSPRFQSDGDGSGLIPVDTVPAGDTREDVGSIPTPGHLQIDATPLMVRGYVRRGCRRRRKFFVGNDLLKKKRKNENKLNFPLDIDDQYGILRE